MKVTRRQLKLQLLILSLFLDNLTFNLFVWAYDKCDPNVPNQMSCFVHPTAQNHKRDYYVRQAPTYGIRAPGIFTV